MRRTLCLSVSLLFLAACLPHTPYTRDYVSRGLQEKTGQPLPPPGEPKIPPGVSLDDGLSEDEAAALALWNNAAFRTDLAELTAANATLIEAGQLPNPLVSFLHLFGVKGQESYLLWPVEALVQRPRRILAAGLDVQKTADDLIGRGTALSRDVRIAYADLDLAEKQAALAGEDARLRKEVAAIAAARLRAGDISGQEESAARLDALRATDSAEIAVRNVETSRIRFALLLGLEGEIPRLSPVAGPEGSAATNPLPTLLEKAYASRPDLRSAQTSIDAAGARLGWEKTRILKLTATLDNKEKGEAGSFTGPSAKLEIPIFNRNEGGTARARAEMERAAARYDAVRQQIAAEVREAFANLAAAKKASTLLTEEIAPAAAEAAARARKSYTSGEESFLFVLDAERRAIEALKRAAEVTAEVRRAEARLNWAVGSILAAGSSAR